MDFEEINKGEPGDGWQVAGGRWQVAGAEQDVSAK
jgi:hypothetical protein